MSMTTVSETGIVQFKNELALALVKLSNGRVNRVTAEKIAERTMKHYDFDNSALAHKGARWIAKEILSNIKL